MIRVLDRLRDQVGCYNYGMERGLVASLSLLQRMTKLSLNWKGVKDSDFQHE
jgi:hypothetical protein